MEVAWNNIQEELAMIGDIQSMNLMDIALEIEDYFKTSLNVK